MKNITVVTFGDNLDAMHQVFENMRQHNDWQQETYQVFENTRQHKELWQERTV